jgi:hypothetical protein
MVDKKDTAWWMKMAKKIPNLDKDIQRGTNISLQLL